MAYNNYKQKHSYLKEMIGFPCTMKAKILMNVLQDITNRKLHSSMTLQDLIGWSKYKVWRFNLSNVHPIYYTWIIRNALAVIQEEPRLLDSCTSWHFRQVCALVHTPTWLLICTRARKKWLKKIICDRLILNKSIMLAREMFARCVLIMSIILISSSWQRMRYIEYCKCF